MRHELANLFHEIACGDHDAMIFLTHWNLFCHGVDDLVDKEKGYDDPEEIVGAFSEANILFTLPFYQKHFAKLQTLVMLTANAYADSVSWEKSKENRHQVMADVLRSYGNEMLMAVALICGGYRHMRRVSRTIREKSWADQHNVQGEIT